MKKALKRLVRGDDGRLRIIFIDLITLQEITDLTGYTVISAGSASEEPEPVASVDEPDTPSETQPFDFGAPQGGGGGGALNGQRPAPLTKSYFPPAPPAPTQTTQQASVAPQTIDVEDVDPSFDVVDENGDLITDPTEVERTIKDFVVNNPEMAATELLSGRLIGAAKERGVDYAVSSMDPELRDRLVDMIQAAPPEIGAGLQIHSGYRSPEHQAALYAASGGDGMVAPEGKSQHGFGAAADLSWNGMNLGNAPAEVKSWIHSNAPNFGLNFPMNDPNRRPYEPWHIETIEARTGKPWTPPQATIPEGAPRNTGGSIGGGLLLDPVGSNLQPVSGVPMSPEFRSNFMARPEFPGSLPAEDASRGPFTGRPEFPGALPAEDAEIGPFLSRPEFPGALPDDGKGDRVGSGPFSAPSRPGITPSFGRPEFVGSLPMKEVGPFPARPGFAGALPAEDAQRGPFLGRPGFVGSLPAARPAGPFLSRPEFPGSLPAEDAVRGPFFSRPEFPGSLPAEKRFPDSGPIPQNREDLSVAESIIQDAKTPSGITKDGVLTDEQRRSFADKTPAYFAASGLVDRTAEQISQIARAFSGELAPDKLEALSYDPAAQKEAANMMVTLENRAASRFFGGSFDKALNNSYDSISKSWAIPNTDANYKIHGGTVENFVSNWYKGQYNDLIDNWNNSSYYNPDEASPSWGFKMRDPAMIGDHRFGSLREYGPTGTWLGDRAAFAASTSRPNPLSPAGGSQAASGYAADRGVTQAFAQREGSGTFGTSASPGVGRSSLGVTSAGRLSGGTGGGATGSFGSGSSGGSATGGSYSGGGPTGSGSYSGGYTGGGPTGGSSRTTTTTSRSSAPSAGGYTGSPTSDGYGGSKTPGGGF